MRFLAHESRLSALRVVSPLPEQPAPRKGPAEPAEIHMCARVSGHRARIVLVSRRDGQIRVNMPIVARISDRVHPRRAPHPVRGIGTRARTLTLHYSIWDVRCCSRRG